MKKQVTVLSPVTLQIIWFSMQATPLFFLITLFIMDYLSLIEPVNPAMAEYLHFIVVAVIPVVLYVKKITRTAQNQYINTRQSEPEIINRALQQLLRVTIVGMAIAEIPATVSILYYVLSGNLAWSAIIALVSLALGFMFKPALSR